MVESKGEQGLTFDDLLNEKNVSFKDFDEQVYDRTLKTTLTKSEQSSNLVWLKT